MERKEQRKERGKCNGKEGAKERKCEWIGRHEEIGVMKRKARTERKARWKGMRLNDAIST
jgi:hypothetical protein